MISKEHRFHGQASLRYVYNNGVTQRGPYFATKAAQNRRRSSYRAAVVVSRKVNKSAVARNLIRRRIYAVIEELEPKLTSPWDLVITVFHDSVADLEAKDIRRMIRKQFRHAGIIAG